MEREEIFWGRKLFGLQRRQKTEMEKEENIRRRKMSRCVTDRGNCGDRARILDSEFAILYMNIITGIYSTPLDPVHSIPFIAQKLISPLQSSFIRPAREANPIQHCTGDKPVIKTVDHYQIFTYILNVVFYFFVREQTMF